MTTNKQHRTANKLIVALDVSTGEAAREIVTELKDLGVAFKIGLQLFVAEGGKFVQELTASGAQIFLDLKFHDIPNTVANAAVEAARLGVWMLNLHAAGGREMMERTAVAVRETCARENLSPPRIIAVTVLTSSNAETLREVGIETEVLPQVVRLAKLSSECHLDGVVASALEIRAIREAVGKDFLIVTPGVRPQFEIPADDQKRVATPAEAVSAGADFLVVGRPILQNAQSRREAARRILAEIRSVNV